VRDDVPRGDFSADWLKCPVVSAGDLQKPGCSTIIYSIPSSSLFRVIPFLVTSDSQYWVYILMNRGDTVLYTGVTNDLRRRVSEHRRGEVEGFTKRYNCTKLVHAEPYPRPQDAIEREKQLKNWNRDWKLDLIREHNPELEDLYDTL
jgi:putative endonuclease